MEKRVHSNTERHVDILDVECLRHDARHQRADTLAELSVQDVRRLDGAMARVHPGVDGRRCR